MLGLGPSVRNRVKRFFAAPRHLWFMIGAAVFGIILLCIILLSVILVSVILRS